MCANVKINEVLLYFFIGLASVNALVHCNKSTAKQKKKETRTKSINVSVNWATSGDGSVKSTETGFFLETNFRGGQTNVFRIRGEGVGVVWS